MTLRRFNNSQEGQIGLKSNIIAILALYNAQRIPYESFYHPLFMVSQEPSDGHGPGFKLELSLIHG